MKIEMNERVSQFLNLWTSFLHAPGNTTVEMQGRSVKTKIESPDSYPSCYRLACLCRVAPQKKRHRKGADFSAPSFLIYLVSIQAMFPRAIGSCSPTSLGR